MQLKFPETSLIILCGPSSSGKSTFAQKHFLPTEVISSDYCRALVSDDENSLDATDDAFELLHYIAAKRLKRNKRVVIDATNVRAEGRRQLLKLAKEYHVLPAIIAFDIEKKILKQRHKERADRDFHESIIWKQYRNFKESLRKFKKEGFRYIYTFKSVEEVEAAEIIYQKLYNDLNHEQGPFDIIGDVHGCFDELRALLKELGYSIRKTSKEAIYSYTVKAPEGRKAIFVGDLVDRGPKNPEVLRLVMSMVKNETAICVPGNHDTKLLKKLSGKNVKLRHGLAETMEQLEGESDEFIQAVKDFLKSLISHYVLMNGQLVVAHAGLREEMQGRASGAVRSFCLYGETTGEIDEFGLPVRHNWAKEYNGKATVVYGHTPIPEPEWLNNTLNVDTGCVFGGKLTAVRFPEREIVSIPAKKVYCEPVRPLIPDTNYQTAQQEYDDLLDIADVTGKQVITTRLGKTVIIRPDNSVAALEMMSRFAINPKWMIYLPPTMSPSETSQEENYLEHPKETFEYFIKNDIKKVICETKHMGSRSIVIVCKDGKVAQERFGLLEESNGVCYTRTGRAFFKESELEQAFLARIQQALTTANFWETMQTDWVCLDCELMPWSAKAQSLISNQYAAVGASANIGLRETVNVLERAKANGLAVDGLLEKFSRQQTVVKKYVKAYQVYCKDVKSIDDLVLAPFHILATEGQTHTDKNHQWHMDTIADFCQADPDFLMATPYLLVDLEDEKSVQMATDWWLDYTGKGGEGMVVKPMDFVTKNQKGLIQPALKCRGREYLRIIYGPDYDAPENLKKLRKRGLGKKRAMAFKEFTLGLEALERFVEKQPLRKTHECVFGVLAMETEPVDPRL